MERRIEGDKLLAEFQQKKVQLTKKHEVVLWSLYESHVPNLSVLRPV
jgi:hypothetical protein